MLFVPGPEIVPTNTQIGRQSVIGCLPRPAGADSYGPLSQTTGFETCDADGPGPAVCTARARSSAG
jgi:hypothetical protein